MRKSRLLRLILLASATSLTACGGSGDADENVVRNLFAIGETVEALEDGEMIEGDVSENDQGEGLSYVLSGDGLSENGELTFNADGTFTYKPNANFSGTDSYQYVVNQAGTGETDSAILTINVVSDFETPEEAGWGLVIQEDFNGSSLTSGQWLSEGATETEGNLVLTAEAGGFASLMAVNSLPQGRFDARIQVAAGDAAKSIFAALPMADQYDGYNAIEAVSFQNGDLIAGAHFGIGETNGVKFNSEVTASASTEFHDYAVEWNDDFIRWYIDGTHIHTVDRLNLWAHNLVNDEVLANTFTLGGASGPFDQDLQLVLKLENSGSEPAMLLVDSINVWTCDPLVAPALNDCSAKVSRTIDKLASDKIPTIEEVTTDVFVDGFYDKDDVKISDLQPLVWHHTDQIIEMNISNFNSPTISTVVLENDQATVIDISSTEGDANIGFATPGIGLIGHNAVLSFDMYIDSANTLTESFDIRMETGWPYMGMLTWMTADLTQDAWVTYSIPVSEFINTPFIAPDWLTWLPGISEGDSLPLDPTNIGSLLVIEFHDGVHFQLDNIRLTCIAAESCVQAPLAIHAESGPKAPSTVYQAEDFTTESGTQLEDTADEGGGQNVGYTDAGDFLEYVITAPSDGTYYVDFRVASDGGSEGFEFLVDGQVVATQAVESTGGWQEWTTLTSTEFEMTAGQHTVRVAFIGGAINFNWFEIFEPVFEIFVEAEAFVAESGTQLEDTADEGGGQNVGYTDPGDFLEYTVNIPADGTYSIEYRLASDLGSEGFTVSFDGVVVDTQELEATGGWQEWVSQKSTVDLVQGEQTMRIDFVGGAINFNWIKITN